ncbi:MAG TPA: prolipoprotein diacylglyceryl transferase [Gemmatimonadaceae bacterium]|nr:prolipoprotein diacylglyceryl transferase [Gemmatimonadaceae bacterium]
MTTVHPFVIHLGWFAITGFGFAVLMAFVIAQVITQRELQRRGHDATPVGDLIMAAVVGGLVGAKIYYAILFHSWAALVSRGGFVFWGGLAGGVFAVLLTIHLKKLDLWRIADVGGIAVAAAYSIGRTGCWAVGDDYGRPWNSPFAVKFPQGAPPSTAANMHVLFGTPIPPGVSPNTVLSVYPTELFEVAAGFVMFFILWRMRDHKHAEGWLFGVYLVLAGLERFLVEFLRAKDDRFFGGLTLAQLIALAAVVGGVVWMQARRRVTAGAPGIYAEA